MQLVLNQARATPSKPAIMAPGFEISFDQLAGLVGSYAMWFRKFGVTRYSTVAVRSADPAVTIISALAAALLGCRWVHDGKALRQSGAVLPTHSFKTVLPDEKQIDSAIEIDAGWSKPPQDAVQPTQYPGFANDEDAWLVFPSSGTTGTPKFMEFSHATMLRRFDANSVEFPSGDEVCVFLFAIHSPPTLMRALCALTRGAGLVLSSDTDFWLERRVTHVFGSPSQIREVLPHVPFATKIGKALIGGDALPDELARRLLQNFSTVVNTYGSTEANLVLENERLLTEDGRVEIRTIWHDSKVEIVDEDGRPVAPGKEGIVRIRNGYLAPGYVNHPDAEASAFRDGWFYPGDMGMISGDGTFLVTGRTNDILNVGGVKLNAALLDYVLQSVPGVDDAICFVVPGEEGVNQLVALVKAKAGAITPDIASEARIQIAMTISASATPSRFIFSESIPRTENGKPDRAACMALALQRRAEGGRSS